uniref:F-box domain-containing protein n=1 Tax=Panagrellus redivivus TaxID=6233 RepID=A0A7E4VNE3_PANRE
MSADVTHRLWLFIQRLLPFFTALNFSEPKFDTIPLAKLPYGFRNRIIQFIPAEIKNEFVKACAILDRRNWDDHKQVFITDNHKICRKAMNDTFLFRFCKCLDQFKRWRKIKDGDYTIYPVWNSVLLVDEILDRQKDIYVNDTLILHCRVAGYEKVIPRIVGHYTRLELHGEVLWTQLKRLIHPGVKQVRVGGMITVNSAENDEFVDFIVRHCRGLDSTFSLSRRSSYNHKLMSKLYGAFRNHETHSAKRCHNDKCHIVHKDRDKDTAKCLCALFLYLALIILFIPNLLLIVPGSVTSSTPYVVEQNAEQFFTALNFSKPESKTIPLAKLPYGFRKRVIQFIPAEIKNEFVKACAVIDRRVWDDHKQVFIIDNHKMCRKAMNDTFLFRLCKCLDQFKRWRKIKDEEYTIHPVWNSVLLVDEILDRQKDIYVNDTLILHCQPENYEKVIPRIVGHYTRLVVNGSISWTQLKRLIHPGVKQVLVGGSFMLNYAMFDDFVDFIVRHCRGLDYTFSFGNKSSHKHEIMSKLYNAFRNHETHSVCLRFVFTYICAC